MLNRLISIRTATCQNVKQLIKSDIHGVYNVWMLTQQFCFLFIFGLFFLNILPWSTSNTLSKCQFSFLFFGVNWNISFASSLLQVTWIFLSEKFRKKKFHSLTFLSSTFSGIYSDVPLFFRFYICSITLDFFLYHKKAHTQTLTTH